MQTKTAPFSFAYESHSYGRVATQGMHEVRAFLSCCSICVVASEGGSTECFMDARVTSRNVVSYWCEEEIALDRSSWEDRGEHTGRVPVAWEGSLIVGVGHGGEI